jgi:hypothetical protein
MKYKKRFFARDKKFDFVLFYVFSRAFIFLHPRRKEGMKKFFMIAPRRKPPLTDVKSLRLTHNNSKLNSSVFALIL